MDVVEFTRQLCRQRAEIVDLYARCAELESVKLQLDRETEKCTAKVIIIIIKLLLVL